jgi:hypothetical protein
MSMLSEMIFDDQNAIKLVRKRQTRDEVERYLRPRKRMRRNRIEETQRRSSRGFVNLTFRT